MMATIVAMMAVPEIARLLRLLPLLTCFIFNALPLVGVKRSEVVNPHGFSSSPVSSVNFARRSGLQQQPLPKVNLS